MTRNVVFDVGGVLLDWNPRFLYRKLLPDEDAIDQFFEEVNFSAWNMEQDAGRSWDDAVVELSSKFPHHANLIEAAHTRWIEMISGPIEGTVAILEALNAAGVPLYAITNFSSEKWRDAQAQFPFLNLFRDVVVSGDEKVLKPDAAIYHCLLTRNELQAQNCIFIDDSPRNVSGADAVGMSGLHFRSSDDLSSALAEAGLRW